MANITNKIIENVISSLEKMKSPENNNSSFWSYLKDQLFSDSTWDQNDLAVIEKEILKELNKLSQKDLDKIWMNSESASKFDETTNIKPEEIKKELVGEYLGKVMDRMGDNISSSSYSPSYFSSSTSKKINNESEDEIAEESEIDETNLDDELENEDLFDEDSFNEEDEENF